MRLPKDILSGIYTKPRLFLCETDKTKICQLNTFNTKGSFKFNSYSELSFEVSRIYNSTAIGETKVHPFYDKIEALRLIYLEGFGYFEIQGPELIGDGIQETKSCTAYSLEYTLSQKFLTDFYVNRGTVDSIEVLNASSEDEIIPVVLYDPHNTSLSLLHLVLEKVYGWKIGHVDKQLQTLSRQFEVDRESVYDFLITEVCEKFNCYIVFDTINNTINVYAESPTTKFIGDGKTNIFTIGDNSNAQPFSRIETVSIDGYKTTRWEYSFSNGVGILVLEDTPEIGTIIEVVGIDSIWETDVFITFDNLSQEVNVSYDADSIKTVLTVTYGDDYDIREVNLGLPYLTDISYYYTVDWMGQELYDAYTNYIEKSNNSQTSYANNSKEILKINDYIYYEENRLSLEYSLVQSVNASTVGTYYTRQENSDGSYYYTEVSLPSEYKVNTDYYSNVTTNVNEDKVNNLYSALKNYFYGCYNNQSDKINDALHEIDTLSDDFKFMEAYAISYLSDGLKNAASDNEREIVVNNFLCEMWKELGRTPLKMLYLEQYKLIQETNIKAGWSKMDNENYGYYYIVLLFISSIESTIAQRDKIIKNYENQRNVFQKANAEISNSLIMSENFTEGQLMRLGAFLREDELHLSEIIETSQDNLTSSFKIKQDAMESGRINLKKICEPQLQFSMNMANIYALPEFESIVDQFQLGNIIKVGLRSDYIKQSRLLQVDINFDDFSDFSCEFGELTSLRTQSDIHADLLSKAISAGKSVATNSSYWTKGSDLATSTDIKIQNGLLDATTQIKSMDGTQGIVIDKNGILLQKINEDGSADPHQTRLINNMILMTDDGWKTSRAGLGNFTIDDQEMYSLIADAVLSGYIEGSKIVGGTIKIGELSDGSYAFEVRNDGSVVMNGGSSIQGYVKEEDINSLKNTATIISDYEPTNANNGQLWLNTSTMPYTLMVFTNGTWTYFSQQNGGKVYVSDPNQDNYAAGDLWILSNDDSYVDVETNKTYGAGSILKAVITLDSNGNEYLKWEDAISQITEIQNNISQNFKFDSNNGVTIGQTDKKFYVNINSQEMGLYDNSDSNNPDQKVVSIGNKSTTIQNAKFQGSNGTIFEGNATFNGQINIYEPDTSVGFILKREQNGSLSLAVSS